MNMLMNDKDNVMRIKTVLTSRIEKALGDAGRIAARNFRDTDLEMYETLMDAVFDAEEEILETLKKLNIKE